MCKKLFIGRLIFSVVLILSSVFILALPARADGLVSFWQNLINFSRDRLLENKNEVKSNNKQEKVEHPNDLTNGNGSEYKQEKGAPRENISVKDVEREVDFASNATGVRKDFLMGMLTVESALGQNNGQCTYAEVESGAQEAHENGRLSQKAWNSFLDRKKIIQELSQELSYDYEKLNVSCNPPFSMYAGTGGAMGMGQFMPDTWLEYKDRIAQIVGNENPDPWSVRDGAVAMALKVSDVPGVKEHDISSEIRASKIYLSGNTSNQYDWYANEIQYWAKNYQKLTI